MGNNKNKNTGKAVYQFRSPGFGRRKATPHPKGRQLDAHAYDEILVLLPESNLSRDYLIENLHLIQDKFGYLSAPHMHALAHEMKLSQAEVYEVASFYAHFDIVLEDETPPPATTIRVCDSLSCEMKGAQKLLNELSNTDNADIRVLRAPCMGRCHKAPVAEVGHNHITEATTKKLIDAAINVDVHHKIPKYENLSDYLDSDGYTYLKKCLSGELNVDQVIETLEGSGLRGLGGAGFPTGRKWKFVRMEPKPRLMAVNGDEGEPGTIKDHHYLTRKPHQFLEGMLIGAWAIEAETVYIYIRDEYPDVIEILRKEVSEIQDAGLSPHTKIEIRRGAGAYICGEESAMIESIEGKRGLPRHRPPFVAQKGIFNRPTLVNNVESLYWVPEILEKGSDWFTSFGENDRKGLRSFSVSGRVKEPGVKLAPAGITIDTLINDYCGGMQDGQSLKAYLPGGPSGGIFPATMNDIPLDFDTLQPFGGFIGSAAVIVLSNEDNIADATLNLLKFFEDESCGQCTPCRVGTEKAVKLMEKDVWDVELLEQLCETMADASICGLGQAAPNPIRSLLKHFPNEVPQ